MKIILLAFAVLAMSAANAQDKTRKLPSVMVETTTGKKVNVNTFNNDGKPFVINFWATWCSPCKRELNTIAEVYEDWVDETGVKIIAVSIDDARNKHKVAPYADLKGWEYEIYIDENSDLARALNVNNPPQTFVCNGAGEIVWSHNGYVDGDEDELLEQIKKALGDK
jgi:cytochrome c biogenesis protein CcmG/thiol:disulfide interchange protein DsbE